MAFVLKHVELILISNIIQGYDRLVKIWRAIMYAGILVTVLPICEANSTCTLNGIHYTCSNIVTMTDFPLVLPSNIWKVTLVGTNELDESFPVAPFNHRTWANVLELSILEFTNIKRINEGFLAGLEQLKFLSISSCTNLDEIDKDIFYSTPNIEALHLDENTLLRLSVVEAALIDKLENLRDLSLIGIQAIDHHIVIGDTFVRALHGKNLTYLDISRVPGIYIQNDVRSLFTNLKYLNLSYSKPVWPLDMNIKINLSSVNIEVFDLTGVQYIMLKYWIRDGDRLIEQDDIPTATYVFIQGMNNPDTQISLNARYRFKRCGIKVPKMLDLSKNNCKRLNISFIGNCRLYELEALNLASNNMEYLSPNLFNILPSLKIIDLSNNQLIKMQDMDDFSNMFSQNKDLEIVFLHNNHLTFVPSNVFISNSKLHIIDLSENELVYFNINLSNAVNLMLINLRRNRLKNLSLSIMDQFESLHWKLNTEHNTRTYVATVLLKEFQDKSLIRKRYRYGYNASNEIEFEESHSVIQQYVMINILENQFMCDCDTLVFIEWILFTNIDIVNKTLLSCKYGNNEKLLNYELLQIVQTDCRIASTISIGVASLVAIIISLFTFAITIRLRRKSDRRNQDLENLKQEILQVNTNFEFLIFLSYCSRDAQIVEENILPFLNKNLRETFHTERNIVCTGDNYFVPGMRIIEEIHRCVNKSLVVVPVITPEFLQSDWSQAECVAAVERHKKVVILMKKHTDTSGATVTIQHIIGQYTRGTWSDNGGVFDIRPSWNTICEGIIRAASEAFRQYRNQHLIEPAEDNPLVDEIV
ncbi:hypothetical protein ACJMK2_000602 [Sinanodonta woodiana]|uniref:TIR domain-containing protein n=1 Tax=Sinanodonta woodiana TaxID=1069815 RepID=A0ABD3XPS0_SINWO